MHQTYQKNQLRKLNQEFKKRDEYIKEYREEEEDELKYKLKRKFNGIFDILAILFNTDIPERWNDVGVAMITLFQVLTLSSWEQVMLPLQDIYWWAWIYFFSFISICSMTILNLVIAILVDVVNHQK